MSPPLRKNRVMQRHVSRWEKEFGGEAKLSIGIFGITVHAKASSGSTPAGQPEDVLERLATSGRGPVVLIIDEITHLCHALGPDAAAEFLSGLRSRRQAGGVPLVISGSIGLHHALDDLQPVNDLWVVQVGPLAEEEAVILAARLLLGIGVEPTLELVAELIVATSGIPYYAHAVVDQLRYRGDLDVDAVVEQCLRDDLWNTKHYVDRIRLYYGADDEETVLAILDGAATAQALEDLGTILARVQSAGLARPVSRTQLLGLLDKLEKDHYLIRVGDTNQISSPLLARIWRHHRRLA